MGSTSARSVFSFACAWPRQGLWQLPTPAARYMCAAVVYTRSRSCSLHRQEDMPPKPLSLPKSLACRALGRFERVGYRDAGAGAAALAVRLLGTGRLRQRRFKLGWGVELGSGPPSRGGAATVKHSEISMRAALWFVGVCEC